MTADPWSQPRPPWEGQMRPRTVGPAEVRSVMFATTRMKVGYEVAEVDAFLDQVEMSMEQMLSEIQALRRRIASTDQANEARMYDIRAALEQLLVHLGGPTGQPSGIIDPNGRDVPLYTPSTVAPAAAKPTWQAPPQGPVSNNPPPAASAPFAAPPQAGPGFAVPPQAGPGFAAPPQAGPGFAAPPQAGPGFAAPPQAGPGFAAPPQAGPGFAAPPQAGPGFGAPPQAGQPAAAGFPPPPPGH